ncbi:MAG: DNA internalization-related competence protein ComEC/Rec2 [Gemmatimonadetes bacterium]|nr:DNA internalization-related competence protein ComEC/Rec2 [Gemmatimonadota bacterium]MYH17597.1 DNA internalization-related competence protein ComEC/Rec2 [Gemmatimonadota bacterium]MYK98254.1 DNA internalization-related competence protein ComEC/Rec2 [Gemmatimonadota bacterium]
MQRPALFIAVCFVVGILLGHRVAISPVLFALSAIAVLAAGYALYRTRGNDALALRICMALGLVFAGAFWYAVQVRVVPANDIRRFCDQRQRHVLTGTIVRSPDVRARFTLVTVDVDSISLGVVGWASWESPGMSTATDRAAPVSGRLQVRLNSGIDSGRYGDRVLVSGRLRSPQPARNPGGFDARTYYASRGVHALMSVRDARSYRVTLRNTSFTWQTGVIDPLRNSIDRSIDRTMRGDSAALLKGILLGERRQLPEDLLHTFRSIGLAHILAVSGLHVGLITLVIHTLLSVLRLPRNIVVAGTLGVLVLYAFITNLTPSVVRATIMATLFLAGRQLDRQTDTVNILAVAAIVILLIWPSALFDLSFQLSFLATYAIITGYPRMKELFPERISRSEKWWARWLRDGLLVSVAAQMGALPVVAGTFYQVSWMSAVANLFIGPLVFLNSTFGVLTALTGPLAIEIARLFSAANALVLFAMIHLSKAFSGAPSALVEVPAPSILFYASFYGAGLLLLWKPDGSRGRRTRQARHGLLALCLLVFCYNLLPDRSLRITVLDVGQGDAIFIACPNGRTLLVDGGARTPFYDAGARVILPFLRAKGYRRVDTIIVTHPDLDHYGGLRAVVESVEVGEVLSSGVGSESGSYRAWREAIDRHGIPYRTVVKGDTLSALGGVRGLFLHPDPLFLTGPVKPNSNEVSVVLRLSLGEFSMLLTGDIEAKGEAATVRRPSMLKSTVLKSPHHGSRSSSGTAFLNAVDPEAVAVSAGMNNAFGHPAPEVIERYRRRKAEVFRTDQGGAVMIRSNGRSWDMAYFAPPRPLGPTPGQVVDGFLLTGKSPLSIFRQHNISH